MVSMTDREFEGFAELPELFHDEKHSWSDVPAAQVVDVLVSSLHTTLMPLRSVLGTDEVLRWVEGPPARWQRNFQHYLQRLTVNALGAAGAYSRTRENAVMTMLRAHMPACRAEDLDAGPGMPLADGQLLLVSPEGHVCLRPVEEHDLFTHALRARWLPGAPCDRFDQFLGEVLADDWHVQLMRAWIGYVLSGHTHLEKAAIFVGGGHNGKSTLANLIASFFEPQKVARANVERLAGRWGPADIAGRFLNVCEELKRSRLRSPDRLMYLITAPCMDVEEKYRPTYSAPNRCRHVITTNVFPVLKRSMTAAFFRRWLIFTFPHEFSQRTDSQLLEKLEGERDGILVSCVRAYCDFLANFARFETWWQAKRGTRLVDHVRGTWLRDNYPLAQFVADCCQVGGQTLRAPVGAFLNAYTQWLVGHGLEGDDVTQSLVTRQLKRLGLIIKAQHGQYWGLRLRGAALNPLEEALVHQQARRAADAMD